MPHPALSPRRLAAAAGLALAGAGLLAGTDFGFTTSSQGAAIDGNLLSGSHMYMTWDAGRTWRAIRF
jgi:hypothetical protein